MMHVMEIDLKDVNEKDYLVLKHILYSFRIEYIEKQKG